MAIDRWVRKDFGLIRLALHGFDNHHANPDCDSLGRYFWKILITGPGEADLSYFVPIDSIPSPQLYPEFQHYMFANNSTNVNGLAVSEKVVTIGYAQNRASHIDYNGNISSDPNAFPGQLLATSGHGPTYRGIIKPDIVATANYVMTAMPLSMQADMIANSSEKIDQGAFHLKEGGTSMAAPLVAGGIALFFEKYPNASWLDVKNAIINCPKQDSYTGDNLPDNFWGYGKFNAFGLLTNCAPYYIQEEQISDIFPNPTTGHFTISCPEQSPLTEVSIINAIGEEVSKTRYDNTSKLELELKGSCGLYFIRLVAGNRSETYKVVKM